MEDSYFIVPFFVFVILQLGLIKLYYVENDKVVSALDIKPLFSSRFGWFSYGIMAPLMLLLTCFLVSVFVSKSPFVFISIYGVGFILYNVIVLPGDIRFSHFLENTVVIVKPRVLGKSTVVEIPVKEIESTVIALGIGNNLNSFYAINFTVNNQKRSIKLKKMAENIYPEDFKKFFLTRNIPVFKKRIGEKISKPIKEIWKD